MSHAFVNVTPDGLEVITEPEGHKNVICDIPSLMTLMSDLRRYMAEHQCAVMYSEGSRIYQCEREAGHPLDPGKGELHWSRIWDEIGYRVIAHYYWGIGYRGPADNDEPEHFDYGSTQPV